MEVKDAKAVKVDSGKTSQQTPASARQRSVSALSAEKVNVGRSDEVSISNEGRSERTRETSTRERANNLINSINLVSDATDEISQLVGSLAGIAEQASSESVTPSRIQALEGEAREIVDAIKKRANTEVDGGGKPLAGDPLTIEAEEVLGETLEVILPDDSKNAFGLDNFPLSPAENIIKTRRSIEDARTRLEELKGAVNESKARVESVVANLDVALQNAEASTSSVRDLDQALQLTSQITGQIQSDPQAALSASQIEVESARKLQ